MFFLLFRLMLSAQEPEWDDRWGRSNEPVSEVAGEWEGQQLRLDQYRRRPLDLNRATAEEMAELGMLTPLQIDAWIRFRGLFGAADSWYVFQSVPGWTESLVSRMKVYCRLAPASVIGKKVFSEPVSHFFLLRLSGQRADQLPSNRMGGKLYRQVRYRIQSAAGWQGGLLMESDAGERVGKRGPDFTSAFLQWKGRSGRSFGIVGDYTIQLGQGLIGWQGMTFGAGSEVAAVKRQGLALRPYQSVGESRFLRGVAMGSTVGRWRWDGFLSRRGQSAVRYRFAQGREGFRSVDVSGYHRTAAEWEKKNAVEEWTGGGRIGRLFPGGIVHVNGLYRRWSIYRIQFSDLTKEDTTWIRGVGNASVDVSLTRGSAHFFGEIAIDTRGRSASVAGAVFVLDRRVDLSVHNRWIAKGFRSVEGQAFQQLASGRAELGYYTQLRWRVSDQHTVDAFVDVCRAEEPNSTVSMPSVGWMRGLRWQYQPDKRNLLYIRLQTIRRELDAEVDRMPAVGTRTTRAVRVHGEISISDGDRLTWRAEWVKARMGATAPQSGFLSYLEWQREIAGRIRLDIRGCWVSTDGWESRIYAYERDVLYKVGFPAFHGQQLRGYLNVSISLGRHSTCWARFFANKTIDDQRFMGFQSPFRPGFTLQFRHQWGGDGR